MEYSRTRSEFPPDFPYHFHPCLQTDNRFGGHQKKCQNFLNFRYDHLHIICKKLEPLHCDFLIVLLFRDTLISMRKITPSKNSLKVNPFF